MNYFAMFRNNLNNLMQNAGLNPRQLAQKVNINSVTIARYILGQSNPTFINVIKLADYFGVSIDWFIGREIK